MKNAKINFITNHKLDNIKLKQLEFYGFSDIATKIDEQFKMVWNFKKKWDEIVKNDEYRLIENEKTIEINSKTDNVNLATLEKDQKQLAIQIEILMNLAFREGAKQIIEFTKKI